jgi:hypothetical protein
MAARFRPAFGIFEAALLLVLAGTLLWLLRPIPGARAAAAEERAAIAVVAALADAEDALAAERRAAPHLRLDRLAAASPAAARALDGFAPSGIPGVLGNRSYWVAVLLPGRDGALAAPGDEVEAEAARGYCVVAWPRSGAPGVLRALAGLPRGVMWQAAEGAAESGEAADPPVPALVFGPPGDARDPPRPPDWAPARSRRP